MMNNLVNFCMPVLQGKKEVVVGSKVSQSEFDVFQGICESEDRSMSYVLRELAIRGLAYYLVDGRLKTTDDEERRITGSGTKNGARKIVANVGSKPVDRRKTG
jgi:hypothetical protein